MKDIEFQGMINCRMNLHRTNALKFTKNLDDADDLIQETLIKCFRFIDKFEQGTNLN